MLSNLDILRPTPVIPSIIHTGEIGAARFVILFPQRRVAWRRLIHRMNCASLKTHFPCIYTNMTGIKAIARRHFSESLEKLHAWNQFIVSTEVPNGTKELNMNPEFRACSCRTLIVPCIIDVMSTIFVAVSKIQLGCNILLYNSENQPFPGQRSLCFTNPYSSFSGNQT